MSAAEILADIAPQFDDLNTDLKTRFIDRAALQCSATVYGDLYDEAVANLAAHNLTLRARASSGGALTVKRERSRNVEREYHQATDGVTSTSYGLRFAEIRGLVSIGIDNTGIGLYV